MKELVILFSDGYLHIGVIQIVGFGGYGYSEYIINRMNQRTNDNLVFEASNGWKYPYHSVVKMCDMSPEQILQLKRDLKIEEVL